MTKELKAQAKIAYLTGSLKDKIELLKYFSDEEIEETLKGIAQQRGQYKVTDGSKITVAGGRETESTGEYLFTIALTLNKVSDARAEEYLKYLLNHPSDHKPQYYVQFLDKLSQFPKSEAVFAKFLSENMLSTSFFEYARCFQKLKLFTKYQEQFLVKIRQSSFSHIKASCLKVESLIDKDERLEFYTKLAHLLNDRLASVPLKELTDWLKSKSFADYASRRNGEYKVDDILFEVVKIQINDRLENLPSEDRIKFKELVMRKDKRISFKESQNILFDIIKTKN